MGMAMVQKMRNSRAPSRRADSSTESLTLVSMNCFIVRTQRRTPCGNDECPVGIQPVQLGHRDEGGDGDGGVEHQGQLNQLEHLSCRGNLIFASA